MLTPLLPADALKGVRLAVSISDSPDLGRLGLTEDHIRLACGELARLVVLGGGTVAYGGDLRPEGYTRFLLDEIERYGEKGHDTLLVFLAWSVHRNLPLSELRSTRDRVGSEGRLICLDPAGEEIDFAVGRDEAAAPVTDPGEVAESLTAMRKTMLAATQGRMILGGKRSGYGGRLPGVLEEAALTLEAGKPLYPAAGFGGITADIAKALGLLTDDWLPPFPGSKPDEGTQAGLARLRDAACSLNNGLYGANQSLLAATHRPSEIAALVSLGLGQCFARREDGVGGEAKA